MKYLIIPIILFSVLAASGCGTTPEGSPIDKAEDTPIDMPTDTPVDIPTEIPADTPEENRIVYAQSDLGRDLEPQVNDQVVEELSQGNNAFAIEFYKQIIDSDQNLIYSPLSLSLALSMTAAGAEASTEGEMLQALNLDRLEADLHPAFNALLLALDMSQETVPNEFDGDEFQFNIANSIWTQSGAEFEKVFLDTLAQNYGAGIYSVDYSSAPEAAREAINEWVAEETEDKISDLIPEGAIDPLTRLVLANAIYFNGSWLHPFEEEDTNEAPFTTVDGSQLTVEMMHLPQERLQYMRGENFQVVRLPYLSRDFSMLVLVPDLGAFDTVEKQLDASWLDDALSNLAVIPVDLKMPKFDFESMVDASVPLKELGMKNAFDPVMADFSGMSRVMDLFITEVLHKATITVDEQGTEAAAATAVLMGVTSIQPDEPVSLVIDRPFLFFIHHYPTNSTLFMGRVMAP